MTAVNRLAESAGFQYDIFGNETSSNKKINGTTYTVSKQYDLLGRMTKLTYPAGLAVSYQYQDSALGQVTRVYTTKVVNGQSTIVDYVKTAGYLNTT